MATVNGNGSRRASLDLAQATTAKRLASVLVVAFDVCEESGLPLSQLQRIAFVEAALLEFDGVGEHLGSIARITHLLRRIESD